METYIFRPTFIVGMYQQCRRQSLSVGCDYRCNTEPNNPFDKNAVAVFDGGRRVAYIRRESAFHIGKVISPVPSGSFSIRPEKEPQYTNRGPVQFCSQIDKINEEQLFLVYLALVCTRSQVR